MMPRSSSIIWVQTASKKARSWVTNKIAPLKSFNKLSSQLMESKSKWLVGSSNSKTSGIATKACAKATRFLFPPDKVSICASGSKCKRSKVSCTRCSQFQPLIASSFDCNSSSRWWAASSHSPTLNSSYSSRKALALATPSETTVNTVSWASKIGSWAT